MTSSRRESDRIRLKAVDLYAPEYSSEVDVLSIRKYLSSLFPGVTVKCFSPLATGLRGSALEGCASALAASRVKDPSKRVQSFEPMFGEVEYERRTIAGKSRVGGIVYDGRRLEGVYRDQIQSRDFLRRCSVVFTQRLVSTFSQDDFRHHLRTIVCGFPSVVSIPGIIEAPAKPREYYFAKQQLESAGAGELELIRLKSMFKGRYVDYGDPSVNEVAKGLALQAIVFHLTLKPFCKTRTCRLFNAHWQEDLIRSQVESGRLCAAHSRMIGRLARTPLLNW